MKGGDRKERRVREEKEMAREVIKNSVIKEISHRFDIYLRRWIADHSME